MEESSVYILASHRNGTLYIGATTDLIKRVWEHKNKIIPGFTAKYNVHQLVYYEMHQNIMEAARRERRLKNWCRKWKLNLIEKFNPMWRDLYEDICS
jgi:putative endonuclease